MNISSHKVSLLKSQFMSVFLGQRKVIQKVGLKGQPQWERAIILFYTWKVTFSQHLLKWTYFTHAYPGGGGRGPALCTEIGLTLVQLFYDNIM